MPKIEDSLVSGDVYSAIADQDLPEPDENIRRYLTVVRHIFDHIRKHEPKILTELRRRARLRKQRAHK